MNKLTITIGGAILVTLSLLFIFTGVAPPSSTTVCNKESCRRTTEYFLKNMNSSVDPCDNFYEYACGGLTKEDTGTLFYVPKLNDEKLKNVLSEPIDPNEPKFFRLIKTIYHSCLDKNKLKARKGEPLLNDLKNFGGWPVLEGSDWADNDFHWQRVLGKLSSVLDINFVLSIYSYGDDKNSSRNIIIIDQAKQEFPATYQFLEGLENENVRYYLQFMINSVTALGGKNANAMDEMKKALNLEIEIAKLIVPPEEQTDPDKLYNKMTVRELQEKVPGIDWIEFINLHPFPRHIPENEEVNVQFPEYIKNIVNLFNRTPKRTVANFIFWHYVKFYLPLLEIKTSFLANLFMGKNEKREDFCLNKLDDCAKLSKGLIYIRKVYNKNTKPITTGLIDSLKNVLYKNINMSEWLQPKTKTEAKIKLASLTYDIGFPPQAYDDELLESFYKDAEIHDNLYETFQSSVRAESKVIYTILDKNPTDNKWILSISRSSELNAMYSPSDNYISILPGIMSEIIVDPERPNYVNYGFLGAVVGHELIHGYDSDGRKYDYQGTLRDWWDEKSAEEFQNRAKCFVDKYSNYTDPITGLKLNGQQTLGEDIADSGGYRLAYNAYQHWLETRATASEPLLPNISLNQKQLFWLSLANFYCIKISTERRQDLIKTDVHSLNEFRVRGGFSNVEQFATDFNCPLGSPMNPQKKCMIW